MMYRMLRVIIAVSWSFSGVAQPAFVRDSLDVFMSREMALWNIPGAAVAIIKDGKVVAMKGFGVGDAETRRPVNEETIFRIGSCTKAFTATGLAMLQEQKKISLDDAVIQYLPEFRMPDSCITGQVILRDLMCHRLGFRTFQGDFVNWNSTLSRADIIYNYRNLEPQYPFRTHWGYNNAGFVTAGEITALVSGMSWDEFMKQHVFDPLEMFRTTSSYAAMTREPNRAIAYTIVGETLSAIDYDRTDNLAAAAAINSSVKDMAQWIRVLLSDGMHNGKRVIPPSAIRETQTAHSIISDEISPLFPSRHFEMYGLGWELMDYGGKKIVSHDGGVYGFTTNVTLIPEEKVGWIIVTNTDQNALYKALQFQFLDAWLNLPYRNYSTVFRGYRESNSAKEKAQVEAWESVVAKKNKPEMDLKNYAGRYRNPAYGEIEIMHSNKQLTIRFSRHTMTAKLEYLDGQRFLCTYSDPEFGIVEVPFVIVEGKPQQLTLSCDHFIDYMSYDFTRLP